MRRLLALVAAVGFCLWASTTLAATNNLLTNGSFEFGRTGWSMPHDRDTDPLFSTGFPDMSPTDGATMAVLYTGTQGWTDQAKLSSWAYQAVDVQVNTQYVFTFDIGNRAAEAVTGLSDAVRDSVTISAFFDFSAYNDDFWPIFGGQYPGGSTSQSFALSAIPAGTWLTGSIYYTTPATIPTDQYGLYQLRPVIMMTSTDGNTPAQLLVDNLRLTALAPYPLHIQPHDGDANNDGAVDVIDLGVLAKNYDSTGLPTSATDPFGAGSWQLGDFSGDGNVDVIDLGVLAKNYDWIGAPATAIPEPGSAALLAMGVLALLRRSTRK